MTNKGNTNWIYVILAIGALAFIATYALLQNWKVSIILALIAACVTALYNPVRRYMRAFWAVFSLVISINTYSLSLLGNLTSPDSDFDIEVSLGEPSVWVSILLILLCVILLLLDFKERNSNSSIIGGKIMNQKGGNNSTNYQAGRDINLKD